MSAPGPTLAPPARAYCSSVRVAQARQTRANVLGAARAMFLARGYAGTTIKAVAAAAGVSVATVELLFATKAGLLKAAIDVAIAGDDEPVAVLERPWAAAAAAATTVDDLLAAIAAVVAGAQSRSAGLVMAVFEGAGAETGAGAGLADLADQMTRQREITATWIVARLSALSPRRAGLTTAEAVDTTWALMDPVVFERLTRRRHWSLERYQVWFASALRRLLLPDPSPAPPATAGPGPLPLTSPPGRPPR